MQQIQPDESKSLMESAERFANFMLASLDEPCRLIAGRIHLPLDPQTSDRLPESLQKGSDKNCQQTGEEQDHSDIDPEQNQPSFAPADSSHTQRMPDTRPPQSKGDSKD